MSFAMCSGAITLELGRTAVGQVPATLNGPPIQVVPYVPEPGVPLITINPGTLNPFPGGGSGSSSGSGDSGDGSGDGSGSGTGGGGGGNVGGSDPLNTMMAQSWGPAAVAAAQSLGVNPSAIAATCVLESGCQNPIGGAHTGTFQMSQAAFDEGIHTALAANPALASQIVQGPGGVNDPLTAAIATAGYQMQGVQFLQNAGISDPTVLQTRGYFNFGGKYASQVAQAPPDSLMGDILPASFLSGNHIPATETLGQWQAGVSAKIGNAAGQPVLLGG